MITFTNAMDDGPIHFLKGSESVVFLLSSSIQRSPGEFVRCTHLGCTNANIFVKESIEQVLGLLKIRKPRK